MVMMMIFYFEVTPCILVHSYLRLGEIYCIMKLKSGRSSETSIATYQTTSCHMLDDYNFLKWEDEHE
jgi:hypothetical protein